MSQKAVSLEIDSSIMEKNLYMMPDETEFQIEQKLKNMFPPTTPSKLIKPAPGFCVKSHSIPDGDKVFINVCQTDAIPSPADLATSSLLEILNSDKRHEYRVPMSIGEVRTDRDNKGNPAKVVDIAINPKFCKKIQEDQVFQAFFLQIVIEALSDKYSIAVDFDKRVVLKNKKVHGQLQTHRIQDRDVAKVQATQQGREYVEPLPGKQVRCDMKKPLIEEINVPQLQCLKEPLHRILRQPPTGNAEYLVGEFKLEGVYSSDEVTLDIGEDRIVLEAKQRGYLLDTFIAYSIDQDKVEAHFNRNSSILTVTMPLAQGA